MASKKNYKTFENNNDEDSNNSISNSGSSSEPKPEDNNGSCRFIESCPAVLEPSKDESHRFDGRLKNALTGLFTRSCPQPSTLEASISSSEHSHSHEDEQQHQSSEELLPIGEHQRNEEQHADEPRTNCCSTFMESYKSYAYKIGISWFIYIFQLLISLICVSAIVMGIIFFLSCEGRYSSMEPFLTILLGIFGLVLVYKWFVKVLRQRRGNYFWNHEKNTLILIFVAVMFAMAIEFTFFTQMSPKLLQEEPNIKVKCPKTYYDYLYYMHIVNAVCLFFAALLYLPDCCIYIYYYQRVVPSHANGHVEPI